MLILKTGSAPDLVRDRHGDFDRWFVRTLAADDIEMPVIDVEAGDSLTESPQDFDGVLVTGSPAMVSHRLDWSERTADWLRGFHQTGRPLLGVCYGHQLIAHALGGEVGPNPAGRQMGTKAVQIQDPDDPLLGSMSPRAAFHVTHMEAVLSPPADARVIATTQGDPNHALYFGACSWGVQFHPEFDASIMSSYIELRADLLDEEGKNPDELLGDIQTAPAGPALLQRFAEMVRQARARR